MSRRRPSANVLKPGILLAGGLMLATWSCGESATTDPGPEPTQPPRELAATLELDPASIEFGALGETEQISVTARDRNGNVLSSFEATWSSSDSGIARVDGDGVVSSVGGGRAAVSVTVDTARSTAAVIVRNRLCATPPISAPPTSIATLPAYTFQQIAEEQWPYPETFPWIAALDIGAGGAPDVFVVTAKINDTPYEDDPGGAIFLLRNGGDAFTRDSLPVPSSAVNGPGLPIVFDADGDGLDDVLAGQYGIDAPPNSGALDLLFIQRGGTLVDESERLNPHYARAWNIYAAAAADIDCDGDVDFYSGAGDKSHLYVNDGGGIFSAEDHRTPAGVSGDPPILNFQGAGFCEVDRDGAPELMLTATGMEPDRLLMNDGFGRFTNAEGGTIPDMPYGEIVREVVVCDDFDHDGWNDMILGESSSEGSVLRLLLNRGDGTFVEAPSQLPAGGAVRNLGGVRPVDVDGDGWTDIVAQCDVLMNDGGTFVRYTLDAFVESPFECFSEDGLTGMSTVVPLVHRDGRVDLYLNTSPPTLLVRQ